MSYILELIFRSIVRVFFFLSLKQYELVRPVSTVIFAKEISLSAVTRVAILQFIFTSVLPIRVIDFEISRYVSSVFVIVAISSQHEIFYPSRVNDLLTRCHSDS